MSKEPTIRISCYACKEPITPEQDYAVLKWFGKTWAFEAYYHADPKKDCSGDLVNWVPFHEKIGVKR